MKRYQTQFKPQSPKAEPTPVAPVDNIPTPRQNVPDRIFNNMRRTIQNLRSKND